MLFLAGKYPSPVVSKRDICDAEGITPAFLTKILQPLIRKGLVNSKRGVAGGFQLAKDPDELTVWDIMQAVEEPLALNVCLTEDDECGRSNYCPVHCLWLEMKDEMKRIFSSKSLSELAGEREKHGAGPLSCQEPGCLK
jgi:Rrf2 family protein